MSRGVTQGLNDHEENLSRHQDTDFRSANLFRLVAQQVIPGTVMDVGAGGGGMVGTGNLPAGPAGFWVNAWTGEPPSESSSEYIPKIEAHE